MTEFQIVTAVMNLVTSHEGVTNTSLSPDQVAEEVDTLRVRMIDDEDKISLFRRPYTGYVQTIPSVTVEKDSDKKLFITIPRLVIKRDDTPASLYIGGKDGKSPYRVISGADAENAKHDQFIGKLPIALYQEGKVTIINASPSFLKVMGVFEDPSALETLGAYDSETSDYPLPAGLIDALIGKTVASYIPTLYRTGIEPNTQSDRPVAPPANARR